MVKFVANRKIGRTPGLSDRRMDVLRVCVVECRENLEFRSDPWIREELRASWLRFEDLSVRVTFVRQDSL